MGKISNYTRALAAKLTDLFIVASDNAGTLENKAVTTEQIGDAVAGVQTHSTLNTSSKTLIGGINENASNIGGLSSLTTSDKSSLVGAVNEVNTKAIKTKTETLTANQFGTITPSVTWEHILQIQATNATSNLIILPIYNREYKVYSISGSGTLTPFSGSIGVYYSYFE